MKGIKNLYGTYRIIPPGVSLFSDYQALMRIWTHPWSLKIESEKKGSLNFIDSDEGSLNDFIVKSGEETTSDEMSWSSSERTSDEGMKIFILLTNL